MNMRTTALFDFEASASENGLPSRVFRSKVGAGAPMAGPSARAGEARAAVRSRNNRAREAFMGLPPRTLPNLLKGPKIPLFGPERSAEPAAPAGRAGLEGGHAGFEVREPARQGLDGRARRGQRLGQTLDLLAEGLALAARKDGTTDLREPQTLGLSQAADGRETLHVRVGVAPVTSGGLADVEEGGQLPLVETQRRDRNAGPSRDRGNRQGRGPALHFEPGPATPRRGAAARSDRTSTRTCTRRRRSRS